MDLAWQEKRALRQRTKKRSRGRGVRRGARPCVVASNLAVEEEIRISCRTSLLPGFEHSLRLIPGRGPCVPPGPSRLHADHMNNMHGFWRRSRAPGANVCRRILRGFTMAR